uniref:Phospholipid/glycerol acyltransferase domain-containing protein n=1 Tax=Mantoniella antarctica TaxID=81844 RepID=A0A7S0SGW0_9CHLO|mmetsp:Transcript_23725/g.58810  ORF Transcript_23725/g.58810 Transcript_23725/m.58810 type:complete len:808 (+) Transcript_23725:123-2546(+)
MSASALAVTSAATPPIERLRPRCVRESPSSSTTGSGRMLSRRVLGRRSRSSAQGVHTSYEQAVQASVIAAAEPSEPSSRPPPILARVPAGGVGVVPGENTFIRSIARQGAGETGGITLDDLLGVNTGGPPRFFSPLTASASAHRSSPRPLLLYLPGLDGTGFAASPQFESLSQHFTLAALNIPVGDRTSFSGLVEKVVNFLEIQREVRAHTATADKRSDDSESQKEPEMRKGNSGKGAGAQPKVFLLGESMGGLLALGVSQARPDLVDRLVLVNPASSFDQSPWTVLGPLLPLLPPELYPGVPYALAPVLFDPVRVVQGSVAAAVAAAEARSLGSGGPSALSALSALAETPTFEIAGVSVADPAAGLTAAADELVYLLPAIGEIAKIVPRDTLAHRLSVISEGCAMINTDGVLEAMTTRTLAVMSDTDTLIPSKLEGERLQKSMPACSVETLEGSSHAALLEAGVDLTAVLRRNGFLPRELSDPPPLIREKALTPPSPVDIEKAIESLAMFRAIVSPVFFSTRADGRIIPGLDAVPLGEGDRPVIFVGNHQTLAVDLGFLIQEFIQQRGVLIRGLTHPTVFANAAGNVGSDADFSKLLTTFGAVPVSGKNLYKLLAAGEAVLLFPGGVREAYKRRNEEYRLFWPSKPEFIRMAVRHGATIVPFAAVGGEDSIDIFADSTDIAKLPFGLGEAAMARTAGMPQARAVDTRVTEDGGDAENFVQPLFVPKTPQRFYFKFGKPVGTAGLYKEGFMKDDVAVQAMYDDVRGEVEGGIDWLLRRRGEDPFGDTGFRTLYEAASGGKQAPTFNP